MSKLTITRRSEWSNRMRVFRIYLDKVEIGTIANGETKTFDIPTGIHELKARVDWCGSREISVDIAENQIKYYQISGFKLGYIIMPLAIVLIVLHYLLKALAGINYVIWFLIPSVLILFYYITFGRNDYLVIRERDRW